LNQSAFAKELGVDRSTVTLWKRDGMPVNDRDAAIGWLAGKHPKYVAKLADEVEVGDVAPLRGGDLEGLDLVSTLNRFREIEYRAWKDLEKLMSDREGLAGEGDRARRLDAAIISGSKRYRDATSDRLEMEERVAAFELETGRRVAVDKVHEWINDRFAGLVVLLRALPHTVARECNPEDPETAKRELIRAVDNIMRQQRGEVDEDD
jgi:hypothetical protein